MSTKYDVEALLRPPVEYMAAFSYFAVAFIMFWLPNGLMLVKESALICGSALLVLGINRFRQAWKVRKYQNGLLKIKPFTVSSSTLPVSNERLWLGKGFTWDSRHTQRLADLGRKNGRKYLEPSKAYLLARHIEMKYEKARVFNIYKESYQRFHRFMARQRFNPVAAGVKYALENNPFVPLPPVGGDPTIHAVGLYEGEKDVSMSLGDRVGHTLVLGTTRVGKTRLAELLIAQDIRRGDTVIVFDPKGDADLFMRMYVEAQKAGRIDNFYFFHLGHPEISARYNPVGTFSRITEVASRIANQLPGEGQSAAFREFVWRYVNVIAKALTALGRKSDYNMILDYGQDIEPLVKDYLTMLASTADPSGEWQEKVLEIKEAFDDSDNREYRVTKELASRDRFVVALLRYCKDKDLFDSVARSLARTFEYDRGYFDKLVSSLLPLMEKLTTGKSAELLSPDYLDQTDTRPIFTWQDVIRTKGIVYVGLDALTDPEVAGAVGNAMFSDLTSLAGYIYKHGAYSGLPDIDIKKTAVNIHADEFNELIGDEFIPMLNKAGGAGFQVTAYTQTWSDVEARLQDKAKAGQVAGNFNTLVMMRVREQATAEMLTKQFDKVEINLLTDISGYNDIADTDSDKEFTSSTSQRKSTQQVELIHPKHIMTLPKGQCFALLDGGKPFKLRLPLADSSDFNGVPSSLTQVADEMRQHYTTNDDWYNFVPSWRDAA